MATLIGITAARPTRPILEASLDDRFGAWAIVAVDGNDGRQWVDCGGSGERPGNLGSWHVRDVTPAATRAAAIKGGADIPARSPFMLRPRCRTLGALSCSDPR